MLRIVSLALAAGLALAGCAGVSTKIVELKPGERYAPTQKVEVLLQKPKRPHAELALLESRGFSEAEMLEDAREKARALGADAIVKLETERQYHEPVAIYDPWWHDPFFWGFARHRYPPPFYHPWGSYRVMPGGYSYVLKTLAIKYRDVK